MGRLNVAGPHTGDDGSPDPAVAAALASYAAGREGEETVLAALAEARLLVPVVALRAGSARAGNSRDGNPRDGSAQDGSARDGSGHEGNGHDGTGSAVTGSAGTGRGDRGAQMTLPSVIGADGRAALPVFTCLAALQLWQAGARPVPVPAGRVWQAAVQEASAVVVDIAGPVPLAVEGARLAALAAGQPAPPPHRDPDVLAAAQNALAAEPLVTEFGLLPGGDSDLTLAVRLAPGRRAGQRDVRRAIERSVAGIMAGTGGRFRRGIAVAVAAADPE